MQKYQNNIVSSSGTPVISASISVTNYPSGTAATIYSDNGVTLATNPLTSDSLGNFSFYAADGRYSLSISGVNVSATTLTDILLEDPTNPNPISATTISATGTSTLQGVTATSLGVSGAATVDAGMAVTGALSATGALTTNGLKEDSSGNLGIGIPSYAGTSLNVSKSMTGATQSASISIAPTVYNDVTSNAWGVSTYMSTQAAAFTLPTLAHFSANQNVIGAGSTVASQYGFYASASLVGATNNYGFHSNIPAGTNRYNFYAAGTAPNRFVGETLVIGAAGLGYGTGAGGTVTQATSRSTAVTINKPTGAITLFSAAGSATWGQFIVNNSLVNFSDTVVLSVVGGASNTYITSVVNMAGGSFTIAFSTTGGTAVDAPTINFAIIKGATA